MKSRIFPLLAPSVRLEATKAVFTAIISVILAKTATAIPKGAPFNIVA